MKKIKDETKKFISHLYSRNALNLLQGNGIMKLIDNEHLFRYLDPLQQELLLALVDEDVFFDQWIPFQNRLIEKSFNERDLEVMLDSVGCIDHPA